MATGLTGSAVLLVDVREPAEAVYGGIPGAVLVPRGLLEFGADSTSLQHVDGFAVEGYVTTLFAPEVVFHASRPPSPRTATASPGSSGPCAGVPDATISAQSSTSTDHDGRVQDH